MPSILDQSDTPQRPACCAFARNLGRVSLATALAAAAAALLVAAVGVLRAEEKKPADNKPPEGAVVLFDGKDLSKWQKRDGGDAPWKLVDDGAMEVSGGGDIATKDKFTDFKLHIEFMPPNMPEASGQGKGNSGVYLQDAFEIQVLDSYGLPKLEMGDCASIYGIKIADKNMAKPPAQWQTYDIEYKAPKLADDGKTIVEPAEVTVYWNGEKVHDKVKVDKVGGGGEPFSPEGGPIRLQDHGNPVRYRNIWIVPQGKKDEAKKDEAKPESK